MDAERKLDENKEGMEKEWKEDRKRSDRKKGPQVCRNMNFEKEDKK